MIFILEKVQQKVIRKLLRMVWYISLAGFTFTVIYSTLRIHITADLADQGSKRLILHDVSRNYSEKNSVTRCNDSTLAKPATMVKKVIYDKNPLNYIPSVSEASNSEIIPFLSDDITKCFLDLPETDYKAKVTILTPIRNSERFLDKYGLQISKLSYPHKLLSLYFGEDGSTDKTFEKANATANHLRKEHDLENSAVTRLNISGGFKGSMQARHREELQLQRRAHMAMARNNLMQFALKQNDFDYTLWIDSDIKEFPSDLVQQMLFAKSDVVATSCLSKKDHKLKYDRNSWRETNASVEAQYKLAPEKLMLEGYHKTLRVHLTALKAEGRVVPLDGVGGCALMVKADCFRKGLTFPEKVYKHHIETEGLAKMARNMGLTVVGLPFVEVFHD